MPANRLSTPTCGKSQMRLVTVETPGAMISAAAGNSPSETTNDTPQAKPIAPHVSGKPINRTLRNGRQAVDRRRFQKLIGHSANRRPEHQERIRPCPYDERQN